MKPFEVMFGFKPGAFEYSEPVDGIFTVKCRNVMDRSISEITLSDKHFDNFKRWFSGEGVIQNMLPTLSIDVRERLINGL